MLGSPVSVGEPGVKELAARLVKENPGLAGYDWRERRCAAHADVRTAVHRHLDAVYRASLKYTERSRPATAAELARSGRRAEWLTRFLGAIRLAAPRTVREEVLSGTIALSAFAPGKSRRVKVSRTVTSLEPSALTSRLDVEAALADAATRLPAVPAPNWESVARKLVAGGCPFLALEVYETRLEPTRANRALKATALAAIGRSLGKRPPAELAEETAARAMAAIREGDVDWASSIVRQYEADPARKTATVRDLKNALAAARRRAAEQEPSDTTPGPGEETRSCDALCSMHMVELCNNNKVLWNTNHAKWEPAPCGTRREESFLKECYRQQWLAGTFDNACMRPCESTPEGRDRLIRVLQGSGCFRLKPS
ncbi:MAG TPA: hypothetical protein VEM57_03070 [Candidatus Binatus sp.]|nr:hypothetical protein [Candidatus Binatus sp.]